MQFLATNADEVESRIAESSKSVDRLTGFWRRG